MAVARLRLVPSQPSAPQALPVPTMPRSRRGPWRLLMWAFCGLLSLHMAAEASAAAKKTNRRTRSKRPAQSRRVVATTLKGVSRVARIEFSLPPGSPLPKAQLLPGRRFLDVDIPLSLVKVNRIVARLPEELQATTQQLETHVRVRIHHATDELRFSDGAASGRSQRGPSTYVLLVGGNSEDTRLRMLADWVRLPLPVPTNLGAQLELWQEAARATADRRIEVARRLWEKLGEQRSIRDLTDLRIAELYIITGHVNEAIKRLRAVARLYPRSTGAVLARISSIHLEAITHSGSPTPEQALIAARSGNRPAFRGFAWLRTARALCALGSPDLALDNFPGIDELPENWRKRAIAERNFAFDQSIADALVQGDTLGMLTQYLAWKEYAPSHEQQILLSAMIADAYLKLALYEPAIPHLRRQLAAFPKPDEEARIVHQLGEAYHGIGERDHELASIRYLLEHHGAVPELDRSIRNMATRELQTRGVDAARTLLAELRTSVAAPNLQRVLLGVEADLMEAWGSHGQLISTLTAMQAIGFDDADRRAPTLAAALARDNQAQRAAPLLRRWISKTADPERRDELAYLLADAEFALGRTEDGRNILDDLASHGTSWGLVARARLRERAMRSVIKALAAEHRSSAGGEEAQP